MIGENVALDVSDHDRIIAFCLHNSVDLVVVGPEAPLVNGLADALLARSIRVFGPDKYAAQLEGSKFFTKSLCRSHDIPTADYRHFTARLEAIAYVECKGAPIVIKADGLAAGKGVTVAATVDEARQAINGCFDGAFGKAGASVVIEDYLEGEEASFFAICDGKTVLPLATAQDHKRVHDGDRGANTGGMGAYSPAPVLDPHVRAEVMEKIIKPTVSALAARGHPYCGILYAGLMINAEGAKLIEFNIRFGDPECQVLMMRLKSDIVTLMIAACDGQLADHTISWRNDAALTTVMAARGYPGAYERGSVISGLDAILALKEVKVFHGGTTMRDGKIIANGGRVLSVSACGTSVAEAHRRAYAAIDRIDWPEGFCRRDIGWRAIEREAAKER